MMCSDEAAKRGVTAGMKVSEAQAVCAQLQVREYDVRLYQEFQQRLCWELIDCSPKVSAVEPGHFILDASGLSYLGGEKKLCRLIHKLAAKAGFHDVHVGIADSAFTALVASKFKRRQYYIVPVGCDKDFLSSLTISHLPINDDMQRSLHELGIRTMGQMVSLGEEALVQRFGHDGVRAWLLANGLDKAEPSLPVAEREFKCRVDLNSPIELLHEIQFVLKSLLDRLVRELQQEALWAEELVLGFFNGDDKFDERPIKLLRPTSHAKFLLEVIRLSLEANPIRREVTGITLSISRYCGENWEQVNIGADSGSHIENGAIKHSPDSAIAELPPDNKGLSLTLMLQRFVSRLGDTSVVRPVPNDQHIPEKSALWLPVASKPTVNPVLPINLSYSNNFIAASNLAAGLTLRQCQKPIPALVEFQGETPCSISYEGTWYTVSQITLPERLSGLWWAAPVRRSYYVALLEPRREKRMIANHANHQAMSQAQTSSQSGLLVSLVHDHEENGWLIHGFYD